MTTPQEAAMRRALEALKLARSSHGMYLMSDPPQDAWKVHRVDSTIVEAIESLRTALAQQGEQPVAMRTEIDVTIDDDAALASLRDMIAHPDGDLTSIRFLVGDGHSGYGLYVASADYPEEGATLIAAAPAPQPAQEQEQEQVGINGLTEAETSATMSVLGLSKPAPPWYGELVRLAAWLLSPDATRNFDSLEENTHIGHRQFEKVQEATREVLRNKAWEIRKTADALAALQSAQPAVANIQTKIVKDISAHEGGNCCLPPLPTTELDALGCAYCNHPMYLGRACKNCGRDVAPAVVKTCETCAHLKQGKLPGVSIHDETCYECSEYYANKWEAENE